MRKRPAVSPQISPELIPQGAQPAGTTTWTRSYKVITPLFGGGVTAGVNDPVTIIRGSAVRGHLRFWWRATRGGMHGGDLQKMKAAEAAIWGAAHFTEKGKQIISEQTVPAVQISVEITKKGDCQQVYGYRRDREGKLKVGHTAEDIPAYAAFPLQPTEKERRDDTIAFKCVRKDVAFRLTLTFANEHKDDVAAALWAWETFGGIGARTRRGFGALQLVEATNPNNPTGAALTGHHLAEAGLIPTQAQEIKAWIKGKIEHHSKARQFPAHVPHLPTVPLSTTHLKVLPADNAVLEVWKDLITKLKNFRQFRPSQNGRGPSLWPEAQVIRQGKYAPKPHKFPRAAFGLPIVFHFDASKAQKTSIDTSLEGEGIERFASPLILRPVVCDKGGAVGIALILDGVHPTQHELVLKKLKVPQSKPEKFSAQLSLEEVTLLQKRGLPIQQDVLQAFMKFLGGI